MTTLDERIEAARKLEGYTPRAGADHGRRGRQRVARARRGAPAMSRPTPTTAAPVGYAIYRPEDEE